MARDQMPVNKLLVRWARERAGYSLEEAELKFKNIAIWEDADSEVYPTYPQLESMAETFKVPIAVFFFPKPPTLPPIEKTFRTLPETDLDGLEPRIRILLRKAKALQVNLSTLNAGRNPAKRLITRDLSFPLSVKADRMATVVRDYLGVTLDEQTRWQNPEVALERWRSCFADVGVIVFKDQFRNPRFAGFCLTDPEFPIIYANNTTPKTRQIFTLFHELGHLLFHTSGIDLRSEDWLQHLKGDAGRIEVLCNRFAAAFLVPDAEFSAMLAGLPPTYETARSLAQHFKVSTLVIVRKFLEHRLIDESAYREAHSRAEAEPPSSGGGNYYNNQMAYLGRSYIGMALREYYHNRINETELAELLNVAPKSVATLEERFLKGAA
jgi:Zn-dependent peptidase ImmA (M78 family)